MSTHRIVASLFAITVALAAVTDSAASQARPDSAKAPTASWSIGSLNVQFGAAHLGLTELNRTMTSNSRPTWATDVASIGMSGYARFGRIIVGGSGETAIPERKLSPGWINKVWFGSASVDAGYAIVDGPMFLLYPQASLGVRLSSLEMARPGDFTYDAAVGDPGRGVELKSLSMLGGYGLVGELHLNSRITGPISIGMRAGYATPLGNARTSFAESSVSGTPREKAGSYLRLSIGKPIGARGDALNVLSAVLFPLVGR